MALTPLREINLSTQKVQRKHMFTSALSFEAYKRTAYKYDR